MFWDNFYNACVSRGIKPNPLAKELNIASGSMTSWKNGKIPNGETLLKISEYLGVSVDYLLGRVNEPTGYLKVTYPVETPPRELKTGDNVGNNNNSSVNINSKETTKFDETTTQVAEMFSKMDIIDKSKVLSFMVELSEKKGA